MAMAMTMTMTMTMIMTMIFLVWENFIHIKKKLHKKDKAGKQNTTQKKKNIYI